MSLDTHARICQSLPGEDDAHTLWSDKNRHHSCAEGAADAIKQEAKLGPFRHSRLVSGVEPLIIALSNKRAQFIMLNAQERVASRARISLLPPASFSENSGVVCPTATHSLTPSHKSDTRATLAHYFPSYSRRFALRHRLPTWAKYGTVAELA